MSNILKINFCDFWPDFEANNLFLGFLGKYYNISIDNNPDYLFYSVYGYTHLKYNCIKILFTGENLVPDFNLCDYALGFNYLNFGDRYLRFPLYVYYQWYYANILKGESDSINSVNHSDEELHKRKFCNFIYSNNIYSDTLRDKFFHELSKYKKVDSGGKHLNNVGKPVADKINFIKDYKFTIAFENSSVPGYTTEKLIEPILMKSLPVYYGNPLVQMDFNVNSFIQIKDTNDFNRAIEEIIYLDKNDDIYLDKLKQPKFLNENNLQNWEEKLLTFMENIFNQAVSSARRRPEYGFNKFYVEELKFQTGLLQKKRRINYSKARIKSFITKYLPVLIGNKT